MSPELINFRSYDFKTDIWSLGCILYELCQLKPPFDESENGFAKLHKLISKGKYDPIPEQYSDGVRDLISKMLQVNPKRRPTIDEILSMPIMETISLNVIIFGLASTDKISLLQSFLRIDPNDISFGSNKIRQHKIDIKITASDAHFLSKRNYSKYDAAIILYLVEDKETFQAVELFKKNLLGKFTEYLCICGNKIGPNERKVTEEEGRRLANRKGEEYFEISTASGEGIKEVFNSILQYKLKLYTDYENENNNNSNENNNNTNENNNNSNENNTNTN